MHIITNVGGEASFQLAHAILVYADRGHGRALATVHEPVVHADESLSLGPGRGISTDFVKALAQELGTEQRIRVLPEHVLVSTSDVTVWWKPASIKPIFFAPEDKPDLAPLKALSGRRVPHPPLVFRATAKQIWVRALKENTRPTASTKLAMAPYYNVSRVGSVCTNSMRIPAAAGTDAIAEWERAFFESEFTHQLPGVSRLVSDPRGYVKLWVHLADEVRRGEAKKGGGRADVSFPRAALVGAYGEQTLLQFAMSDEDEGQH